MGRSLYRRFLYTCLSTYITQRLRPLYRWLQTFYLMTVGRLQRGHGHDPESALVEGIKHCDSVYFEVPNGEIAGMAGVHKNGQIWMLCTPAIYDYPHTFAREAKRYVNSRTEKLLWNIVDERNKVHLKLLRFLGFKFLRRFNYGPNNLSFIEFCRVRTNSDWRAS